MQADYIFKIKDNVVLKYVNGQWNLYIGDELRDVRAVLDANADEETCFKIRKAIDSIDGPKSNLSENNSGETEPSFK